MGRSPLLAVADGAFDVIEKSVADWVYNDQHDIAVCPVRLSQEQHKFKAIIQYPEGHFSHYMSWLLHADHVSHTSHNLGVGSDVFVVERFINHEGRQRNLPSVRFGHISMLPFEPVYHPNLPSNRQESFLIDIKTRSEYSGSPVFVYDWYGGRLAFPPDYKRDNKRSCWLLGIEWGQIVEPVEISGRQREYVGIGTGMAGVVPVWRLAQHLDIPELKEQRRRDDEAIRRKVVMSLPLLEK